MSAPQPPRSSGWVTAMTMTDMKLEAVVFRGGPADSRPYPLTIHIPEGRETFKMSDPADPVSVALEQYKARHGVYPDDWEDQLAHITQFIEYRRTDETWEDDVRGPLSVFRPA